MNSVVSFKGQPVEHTPAELRDRLVWLTRFGAPRLGVYDGGWHAVIDMHVADAVKGASFSVKSDFGCADPEIAVSQLIGRMLEALAKLGAA
jgi:hypothetical protein